MTVTMFKVSLISRVALSGVAQSSSTDLRVEFISLPPQQRYICINGIHLHKLTPKGHICLLVSSQPARL
jgi:hypothetical protein